MAAGGGVGGGVRRAGGHAGADAAQVPGGIVVQGHNGAELGGAGFQERNPVQDGGLAGEFVGQHGAGFVILHQNGGKEAQMLAAYAVKIVGMAHQVERRSIVPLQDAVGLPLPEPGGGLLVAGGRVNRVGLFAAFQMDGVVGAALLQLGFQRPVNHIVGRADCGGKAAADGIGAVADAPERFDDSHRSGNSGGLFGKPGAAAEAGAGPAARAL